MTRIIFLLLLMTSMLACSPFGIFSVISDNESVSKEPEGDHAVIRALGFVPAPAGFIDGLNIWPRENQPNWPRGDRADLIAQTVQSVTISRKISVTASAQAEAIFGNVTAESDTFWNLPITWTTRITTVIATSADPKKNEGVLTTKKGPDGKIERVYLDYYPGRDMVISCYIESSYATTSEFGEKISLGATVRGALPVGPLVIGTVTAKAEAEAKSTDTHLVARTQNNGLRRPRIGETLTEAQASCYKGYTYTDKDGEQKVEGFFEVSRGPIKKDLDLALLDARFHMPNAECTMDADCEKHFYPTNRLSIFERSQFERTTPRCIAQQKEGIFLCELRAKENERCSVYTESNAEGERERLSNGQWHESPCDQNLTCETVKAPSYLYIPYGYDLNSKKMLYYNLMLDYAEGRCRKKG